MGVPERPAILRLALQTHAHREQRRHRAVTLLQNGWAISAQSNSVADDGEVDGREDVFKHLGRIVPLAELETAAGALVKRLNGRLQPECARSALCGAQGGEGSLELA